MAFKIYTKTGDKGETGLFGGKRLPKNHIRIEAYGTVDELNSFIGVVRDSVQEKQTRFILKEVQDRLFNIGASLASDPEKNMTTPDILESDIELLEKEIDRLNEEVNKPFSTHCSNLVLHYASAHDVIQSWRSLRRNAPPFGR